MPIGRRAVASAIPTRKPTRRARAPLAPRGVNEVVDLSHHNGPVDLKLAKQAGIFGVIHKVSQGLGFKDPLYEERRAQAIDAGLRWGAYHFGTGSDGVSQAEHFLAAAQPGPSDLLVLDFEANLQGPSMSLVEAHAFVTHVQQATGRWPGLYSGHYVKELLGTSVDPVLSNCWFWLAQYGTQAVVPPTWKRWTLWQYTDGALGPTPHEVKGIGRCDRDRFHGSAAALAKFWGGASPAARRAHIA